MEGPYTVMESIKDTKIKPTVKFMLNFEIQRIFTTISYN